MYEVKITDLSTGKVAYERNVKAFAGALADAAAAGDISTLSFCEGNAAAFVLALLAFDSAKEEWLDRLGIRKAYNLGAALLKEDKELFLKEVMRSEK